MRARRTSRWRTRWCRSTRCSASFTLPREMPQEALAEFEASQRTMPNRFRTIAGAATAARVVGSVEAAKRYYRALAGLAVNSDGRRPELAEAKTYLAQN